MEIKKTFESFITEASRRKVHKAAKDGSYPAVIVVVKDGKVIHQEPVSSPEVAPAAFNVMQKEYPNALLHLEDKTGKRLFSESVVNEAKIKVTKDEWPYLEFKVGSKKHKVEFDYEDIIDDHGNEGQDQYWIGKDDEGQEWMIDVYADYRGEVEEVHYDTIVKESVSSEFSPMGYAKRVVSGAIKIKDAMKEAGISLANMAKLIKRIDKSFDIDAAFLEKNVMQDDPEKFNKSVAEGIYAKESKIAPGEYIMTQYGYFYKRVEGKVGGQDAYVEIKKGKEGKRKTSIHDTVDFDIVDKSVALGESVVNEMDSEGIQSLADELNAEVYTARLKNGAKSASIKATTTTKTWDDGAPVLKYLARGKAKDMPFTLYQRPFTVLHDVAHGWFYFTDGRKWYGLHGDEGYAEPEDLPFDMEISESVVSEATDINDPVLIRMRQAQKHANDMKKLDAMKKEAEKEARRNRPRWTQKKYDQWLDTVASNGGAENAFDMAKNAEFEPGLIDWVKKNFRGDDPLQRIQWDIEALAESYNDDDINMVYGFYGTVTDNSNEKNAKKLFDQGIKDLKKKYRLTEEESLEVLNSKMGRKAADQIYDGQAKTAVEGLETYYGKTLHKELAEIQKSMVFDSTVTEAKAFTRAEVMDFLENHLKFIRTSEEFDGVEGGIWTSAENGETMGSSPIFDYYSTSSKYEFGVLNKFAKKLSKMGWYCEYYDPGTVMIWPI